MESFRSALEWSNGLSLEQKSLFIESAVTRLSENYPSDAAGIIADGGLPKIGENESEAILHRVAKNLGKKNVVEAVSWIEGLPSDSKPGAVKGLMDEWIPRDPIKASQWLSTLPPGRARDAGARVLADQLESTDPESAKKWADSINEN